MILHSRLMILDKFYFTKFTATMDDSSLYLVIATFSCSILNRSGLEGSLEHVTLLLSTLNYPNLFFKSAFCLVIHIIARCL